MAKLILSFKLGVKVGKGDLREAKKAKLFEVGRMEHNGLGNMQHWRVVVDEEGVVIAGGIREAVRRGIVTVENYEYWWGLWKRENGDVYDVRGIYGKKGVVYGRIVDGVEVVVEEDESEDNLV